MLLAARLCATAVESLDSVTPSLPKSFGIAAATGLGPSVILLTAACSLAFVYGASRWRTGRRRRSSGRLEADAEARLAELSLRDAQFSALCHELREALERVLSSCDSLEPSGTGEPANGPDRVRTLRDEADELRGLLEDLTELSPSASDRPARREEVFELGATIRAAVRATNLQGRRHDLVATGDPVWLRGNPGKLQRILLRVIAHTLQEGKAEALRVEFEVGEDTPDSRAIRIGVRDTNAALAGERPEVSSGPGPEESASGPRFTLAVAARMVEAMGGKLVEASPDGWPGCQIHLRLPVAPAPIQARTEPSERGRTRVLAIEGERYQRLVLGHLFDSLDCDADWAVDGASAVECLQEDRYDVIFLDLCRTSTDGADLLSCLLSLAGRRMPLLVAVAPGSPDAALRAMVPEAAVMLQSPVSRRRLQTALQALGRGMPIHPSEDVPSVERYDFSAVRAHPEARKALESYTDDLAESWARLGKALCEREWADSATALAEQVHAFQARLLHVSAVCEAEELSLLEEAVRGRNWRSVHRLVGSLGAAMADIAEAAREHANAVA